MRTVLITALLLCCVNIFAYHDPNTGRFISRDPIEEDGGLNLYAMVWNNPINRTDNLGLKISDGSTKPEPPKIPPEGEEEPGEPPGGNCGGGAWGDPTCFKSPSDIKRDCTPCGKGVASLTQSPCNCTEREIHLMITSYVRIPLKGQAKVKDKKGFHMVGRTIPGKQKSEKAPVTFKPGVPWGTVLGDKGPGWGNIQNPESHFKYWMDKQEKDFKKAAKNQWKLIIVVIEKGCYCCP